MSEDERPEGPGPDPTRPRYLTPQNCRIHVGKHGVMHVTVKDERTYGGVYAAYVFPVAHSDKYISLIQSTNTGQDSEIGIIHDLEDFLWDQADLVRQALARRYFIHTITKCNRIAWEKNMVRFEVETDKGPASFLLRWKSDRAVDYGRKGKVLIDVDENRYVIPDISKLSQGERDDFTRVIYW